MTDNDRPAKFTPGDRVTFTYRPRHEGATLYAGRSGMVATVIEPDGYRVGGSVVGVTVWRIEFEDGHRFVAYEDELTPVVTPAQRTPEEIVAEVVEQITGCSASHGTPIGDLAATLDNDDDPDSDGPTLTAESIYGALLDAVREARR